MINKFKVNQSVVHVEQGVGVIKSIEEFAAGKVKIEFDIIA